MTRALILGVAAMLIAACTNAVPAPTAPEQAPGQTHGPGSTQTPGGGGSGNGAALAAAANALTDWCTVMPADLVAELVPGEALLTPAEFPSRCTASNQVQALEVSYQDFSGAVPASDATMVSGLGETAWFSPTGFADDAYLTVILFTNPNGLGAATLYVEMAGHDGVDHADDAVAVARAVIGRLE